MTHVSPARASRARVFALVGWPFWPRRGSSGAVLTGEEVADNPDEFRALHGDARDDSALDHEALFAVGPRNFKHQARHTLLVVEDGEEVTIVVRGGVREKRLAVMGDFRIVHASALRGGNGRPPRVHRSAD